MDRYRGFVGFCASLLLLGPAAAGTIVVSTGVDVVAIDGMCSLREAVENANLPGGGDVSGGDCAAGAAGSDTVELPAGVYALSIAGVDEDFNATGDLDITDDLLVEGAGAASTAIEGDQADRILHFLAAAPDPLVAEVRDVTIRNGGDLLALGLTGAIRTSPGTDLHLVDSVIEENRAFADGAISSLGALTVTRCTIRNNEAYKSSSALFAGGTSLAITDSVIEDNVMLQAPTYGTVRITQIPALIERTLLAGNRGVHVYGSGNVTIRNSTLSSAVDGSATNLFNSMRLDSVTVTGNEGGGLAIGDDSTTTVVKNTIVAGNGGGPDCIFSGGATLDSEGYNLDSDGTCFGSGPSDLTGISPNLGPLQHNGGPTRTHALISPSPAIDSADPSCVDSLGNTVTEDQRLAPRPRDGDGDSTAVCDRGAFEADVFASPPGVPDGSVGTPLRAERMTDDGAVLSVTWDVALCPAPNYHLVYGSLDDVSGYALDGAVCAAPVTGAMIWADVPVGDLYFLMLTGDGATTEGPWGQAGSGPRNGENPSLQCGMITRINTNTCP